MLEGYKTYIFSTLLALSAVAYGFGYIDGATFATLAGVFGAGAGVALRSAV